MDEILREVLIKMCGNRLHDKIIIIENLPKKFLFEKTRKMIVQRDREGFTDGTMMVDPSGEMIETLRPGIEKSQTGDGGLVFFSMDQESMTRFADIMRYIEVNFSRDHRIPSFVDNAQQIGNPATGPLPYSQIPRIQLPAPIVQAPPAPLPTTVSGIILPAPTMATTSGMVLTSATLPAPAPATPSSVDPNPRGPTGVLPKKKGMTQAQRDGARARMLAMHAKIRARKAADLQAVAAA